MTFPRLIVLGLLLWLILAIAKVFFFQHADISSALVRTLFGVVTVVVSTAMVRRLGVINFLEGALAAVFWFVIVLTLDFIALPAFLDFNFFTKWETWGGYGIMLISIFFFHKKRHVQIRKELAAKHDHH